MATASDLDNERSRTLPVGVVLRQTPGVTRWAGISWRVSGLLPGAAPGHWAELRREAAAVEYHAATAPLTLWRTDTEAYLVALNATPPCIWVVLRQSVPDARPEVLTVTASAYEAQDYADNGEDIVERVPMPEGLRHWIGEFVARHHRDEAFVKRKRRPHMEAIEEDGVGDARVRQAADVFRSPRSLRSPSGEGRG